MKRVVSMIAALALALCSGAWAEDVDISDMSLEALLALGQRIDERIGELEADGAGDEPDGAGESAGNQAVEAGEPAGGEGPLEAEEADDEAETLFDTGTESEEGYLELEKGDENDEVRRMQERLAALGFLEGKADGDFGRKTENAVKAFQKAAGLEATGIADAETLEALYAGDVPGHRDYAELSYNRLLKDPDACEGKYYQFTGRVLQVLESDAYADTLGIYTVMRVASRRQYDDVVYVTYFRDKAESRILEDARVTVSGRSAGLYTYESTSGQEVTLPKLEADIIEQSAEP